MPRYRPLIENKEVVDVLYCLVLGHKKVKDIVKKLKQPQSTVSEKLRFLIKNNVAKKDRWEFDVNWKGLGKVLRKAIDNELKPINRKFAVFNDNLLKRLMETYSRMVIELGYEAVSIQEMVEMYLIGMGQFSDSELRKISEDFVEIKKELGAVSPENVFFEMSMLLNAKKSDRKLGR